MFSSRRFQSSPSWRQVNQSRSMIAGVGSILDVAMPFEIANQIVDGLFRDLQALGNLCGSSTVDCLKAEQRYVSWI